MEIVVLIKLAVRMEQLIAHGVVVGVQDLGPVQRDIGNLAFFLIQNGVVDHGAVSSGCLSSSKFSWIRRHHSEASAGCQLSRSGGGNVREVLRLIVKKRADPKHS